MNDSSTGGYLLPTNTAPLNDEALDDAFRDLFSNLTGLNPKWVRRRFSLEPQAPPDPPATWIAVGASIGQSDTFPQQQMNDDGSYTLTRNELIEVLCSFYGGYAQKAMTNARDGLMIAQNRETIGDLGISYMYASDPIRAPVMVQTRWINRIDVTFTFRRQVVETYGILDVTGVDLGSVLITDTGLTRTIKVPPVS